MTRVEALARRELPGRDEGRFMGGASGSAPALCTPTLAIGLAVWMATPGAVAGTVELAGGTN